MRFIDLTMPLENDGKWVPRLLRSKVKYQGHRFGRLAVRLLYSLPARLLTGGLGWANDHISLSTHGTTHVDAPWHYGPTSGGKPAATIDEIPLERFYGPGVVLDMTHKAHGDAIQVEDVQHALTGIKHSLSPGEIVLIRTDGDQRWGRRGYFDEGTGVSAAATEWLIDQGIFVMGIDAWGWDLPLPLMAARAKRTNDATYFWEAHYVGLRKPYCQIERLTNLVQLPAKGFTVICFPLKVKGGSAGPTRVVAMVED
jgi:kynurenine formamidase